MALFRPPIHRAATTVLDRSLFSKTVPIAAARVVENKNISRYRAELQKSKELLQVERITPIRSDPDPIVASKGGKCLLLQPQVKHDGILIARRYSMASNLCTDLRTWSSILQQAVKAQELGVILFNLNLDYNYWTYRTYVIEHMYQCFSR
jgi:tRNA (guanine37-N1)-methyltransferase